MKKEEKRTLNFLRKKVGRMKKITLLVLLVFVSTASFAQGRWMLVYDYQPKFEEIFREPFETLAIYTECGRTITITNHLENRVNVSFEEIENYLESIGSDLASIKVMIHNHLLPYRWSVRDKEFYQGLKRKGFKGQFALYFPWNKSVRYMEEPEISGYDEFVGTGGLSQETPD